MNLRMLFFLGLFFASTNLECKQKQKPWTLMVYMAADNDLDIFLNRNLKQMMQTGSNQYINIVVQINSIEPKTQEKTVKRAVVTQNDLDIFYHSTDPQITDTGNPQTLIDFCTQTIEKYPAQHYGLIFWNHGTGPIDPYNLRSFKTAELFEFGVNEYRGYNWNYPWALLAIKVANSKKHKGICFDETTGNYLTEKKLKIALSTIHSSILNNKKFDLIGFDACLMAMIEIADLIAPYSDYMIASQEVELGTGWDYKKVLEPFKTESLTPELFGAHITKAYSKTYSFSNDYTLSCLNLSNYNNLKSALTELIELLQHAISRNNTHIKNLLHKSRAKHHCTFFDEPDYIDLKHFLTNLLRNIESVAFSKINFVAFYPNRVAQLINKSIESINSVVAQNVAGTHHKQASGLSIYLPEHSIHRSYKTNTFANATCWLLLLQNYLA